MSELPDSRFQPDPWFKKIYRGARQRIRRLRQWVHLEPRKALIYGILLGAFVLSLGLGQFFKIRGNIRGDELASYPSMTAQELQKAIDKNEVVTLTNASALTGGWLGQQYRFYILVDTKSGPTRAVEQIGPSRDEQWKSITQSAATHGFKLKQGYNAFEEIPVMGLASMAMVALLLMGALVVSQVILSEAMSGFKFKPDRPDEDVTMDDIIGYPEVKREISEVLDQVRHAERYAEQGIRAPRGLLMTGDPGVGKTMMAKAIASGLKAEFFTCTGADFAEMYVGVGPKRVRALFRQARRTKNAVIFIDEIDALGSRDSLSNDSERQATLNRMLAEMDGMNGNGNLLVIGATNYPDRLDAALRRPGRFDKKIHIPLPDAPTREGILAKYLAKVTTGDDVDLAAMALRTQAYTGAQLRQVVDEAKNLALRESAHEKIPLVVTQHHLEAGQEIAIMGIFERDSDGPEARRAAIHELGHALTGHLLNPARRVEKVTLKGRGDALAFMFSRPLREVHLQTEDELRAHITTLLGGRAAEDVMLGSVSSGASADLQQANAIAETMVCQLGMGPKTGLRFHARTPGTEWPATVEDDIASLMGEEYDRARALVRKHEAWMQEKTDLLFEKRVLGHDMLFDTLVMDAVAVDEKAMVARPAALSSGKDGA